ncbi:MAG: histidinol-phosphate transaminase [Halioglobus sp.]|nr:histidinol-phosphate transaminase [Halioglobus sp.]|tara:strand:- start:2529 stop:3590 length:1062 start_codon:yes stop_codon:yes gene_type:complete
MSRFWSELARGLTPYVPGEQPVDEPLVKLNTNENPYPPSPAVGRALAALDVQRLRLYPDPDSARLRRAIAARNGLQPQQVFVGNGSDEVLAFAFLGLLKHSGPLCFPDVTYSFYPVWSELCGIDVREVPVSSDLAIDPAAFPADCGGIILPNPNAPTGLLLGLPALRELLARHRDCVVVVDEAYIDFGGESAVSLVRDFDNLLVVQTLSKSRALAGLRVGFALGDAALIEGLERVKNSFNSYTLDLLAEEVALAAFEDEDYFQQTCRAVVDSRESLRASLLQMGFEVLPSAANFLFVHHPCRPAGELFGALREKGVLVRYFARPRIDDYLRISIGTPQQCAILVDALREILGA